MPTVKELLNESNANAKVFITFTKTPEKEDTFVDERRRALKKLNKIKRFQALANDGSTVSFLAYTPGTSQGRLVHGV